MPSVYVDLGLIGDCIAGLPFLYRLSQSGAVRAGPNLNKWVMDGADFPVDQIIVQEKEADYRITATNSWYHCTAHGSVHHMMQGHFGANGLDIPAVPMQVPMKRAPCGLEPGIVFSPFSRTDHLNSKAWPCQEWLKLAELLRSAGRQEPIYVIGSLAHDNFEWCSGLIPVVDRSCAEICDLLLMSSLVATIDTGISHLCHVLGLRHHVLLYPKAVPVNFVSNPYGRQVYGFPTQIAPEQMFVECKKVLDIRFANL